MIKNKTVKTRNLLGGGGFGSSLKSPECQKISVQCESLKHKSKKPFNNLAVMLNSFQHLTGKLRLMKDLCLSTTFDNDDKQLNKLTNQEPEIPTKKHSSCRSYRYRRQERSSSLRDRYAASWLLAQALKSRVRAVSGSIQQGKNSIGLPSVKNIFRLAPLELTPQKCEQQKLALLDLIKKGLKMMNLKPARAFSVAEAMIALLIGSLILGYSAPMVAKQLKHNNMSDVQVQVLNRKIEELRRTQANIPSGAVMFFNLPTCPNGWSDISSNWNGRFPRFAGSYTSLEYDTTSKTLKTTGTAQTLSVGATQEDAIRNITGTVQGAGYENSYVATGAFQVNSRTVNVANDGADTDYSYTFNAENVVPTDIENRPKSVALLGCQKD